MSGLARSFALFLSFAGLLLGATNANALACTSVATGNWGVAGTWTSVGNCNRVPTAADTVTIATGHTITVNAATANVLSVTVNTGAILTQTQALSTAGTLSVAGTLTSNNAVTVTDATTVTGNLNTVGAGARTYTGLVTVTGGTWNNSGNQAVTFRGGITNNGTFTAGTGTQTFDTTAAQAIGGANPINFGGIVAVVGAVTVTNNNTGGVAIAGNLTGSAVGSTWVNAANSTLNYGGALAPMGTRVFTASAVPNTVNYSNLTAAQAVRTADYNNLTITKNAGIAATTAAGTVNVTGALTVTSGTLNIAGSTIVVTGATNISGTLGITNATGTKTFAGLVTVNAGGVWNNSINELVTFRGGITHNGTTFTAGTGVYTFDTNNQAIGGTSAISIPSITVTGVTLTNNVANAAGLTVTTALAGNGGLTNTTLLNLNFTGALGITTLTASAAGNTVNYGFAGTQTVKATIYHHLTLSNTSAKTAAAGLTVNGDFTLLGSASFTASTFTHNFYGNWIVDTTAAAPLSVATTSVINFNTPAVPAPTSMGGTTAATIAFADVNINNTSGVTFNDNASFSTGTTPTLTVAAAATLTPAAAVIISGTDTLTGSGTVQVTRTTAGTADFSSQYTIATKTLTNLTVDYIGAAAQTVSVLTYGSITGGGLKINNASGVSLTANTTVAGTLTLASGVVNAGAFTLIGSGDCTTKVARTGGHVAGLLQLAFPTGTPSCTFHVGDATAYRPINVGFASVTAAGSLAGSVSQSAGEHPNIATSGLDSTKDVNRYWTLTNPAGGTIAYTTYAATFNFINPTDFDAGATPASFEIERWDGAAWNVTTLSGATGTSTSASGLSFFAANSSNSFAVGEKKSTVVSINCASTCATPTGAATVSWTVTFDRSVTGVDATVFSLVPTGLTGAYITSVSGSGTTWTVTANTGIGSGSLGLNQTGAGSVVPTLVGTFTGQVYTTVSISALAEYRMDEASWNGTAGEVVDSSGSGNNAQAVNSASTAAATPAIAGGTGTCRYGVFDNGTTITQGYVLTPLPNLTTDFTVAAWIRTTDNTVGAQRILIDDQNDSGGYGISLGEAGTGRVRFYSRGITPVILDSTYAIANNTWYFVAAVADVTNQKRTIYVFDAAGALLNSTTETAWTGGAWGTDAGPVSIGAETNASGELPASNHFKGNIDDLRVYQKVLSQSALTALATQTHSCPVYVPDHLVIQSSGSGLTCTPSTLTVQACQNAACTIPFMPGVSGTLSATGAGMTVNWDGTTGGAAGAGFVIPNGSSSVTKNVQVTTAGSVVFGITAPSPLPTNSTTCNFGSPTCTFTSALAGFLVSAPNHVSCTSSTLTVKAVKQSDSSLACVPAFASTSKTTTISFSYSNPASGTHVPWVGGTAISLSGTSKSLAFDASGIATPSLVYDDVGRIGISVDYAGSGGTEGGLAMTGTTSPNVIVAPSSFAFSAITAAPITAGADFSATVTAKNACGSPTTTPNFGQETPAEGATLSFTRTSPTGAGVSDGSFSGSLGTFSTGSATGANLKWSEVGEGTLTATLASGSYLSSGLTASNTSGTVGRFKPAYFDTAVTDGCSAFTYSGQPFTIDVTAKNQAGGTTVNYSGSLSPVFSNATTLSDANGGTGTWANNSLATTDFASGIGTKSTVSYTFASRQTAPTAIAIRAVETAGDSVSSSGHTEGTTAIRSGRARLLNANGSEILDLPVPFRVEYWKNNVSGWQVNTADTCSGNAAGPVSLTLSGGPAASTCVWDTGSPPGNSGVGCPAAGPATKQYKESGVAGFAGDFNLWLRAPSGNTGSVTITSTVPAWLQYPWLSSTATSPAARATFGVTKSGPVIFRREMY